MAGITDGLCQVHVHKVSIKLSVPGAGAAELRRKEGKTMSVKKGEEWYGRHGDIKPENMLWFSKDPNPKHKDARGNVKIADFGLGRFHGLDSRSKVPPATVTGTPTYEPPELKLSIPVSRAYDIWSLGCLYLEFVTWLLKGGKAVHEFADERSEAYHAFPNMTDDSFYSITREDGDPTSAVVRAGVIRWVGHLHEHEHCTELIHDILDLVMESMLVVDKEKRKYAMQLHQAFLGFQRRAATDRNYALQSAPRKAKLQPESPNVGSDKTEPLLSEVGSSIPGLQRASTVQFQYPVSRE